MPKARTPVSSAKTERLLNLVICLLYTRRPLPKSKIREAVPQYGEATSEDAFNRMFERDKDELRELGIPLVTEQIDTFFDNEEGYRIDGREYALPELSFEPDELAVLGLASRTWAQASLAGPAAQALRKLEAAGVERDDSSVIGLEPRVRTAEPAFARAKDAVLARRPVRFAYRKARDGEVATRHVQPWAIAAWHGRWYLTGFDLDREAPRVFRLGRVEGPIAWAGRPGSYAVPADHDPLAVIRAQATDSRPVTATLRVREGAGHALRRRATATRPDPTALGWDLVELACGDTERMADELAGYAAAVEAVAPAELREAVIRRLQGAVTAMTEGAP
ncbi:helix-turn-helix transcriptional regulator [Arsenicicoccus sp. oral taxon 190]|uniref:helix-turn-helix transcriptional regulator n=1 Tax=Arsenicicoccus sp. oral taxon 190 TaxID=1658671 RepID=UPI00067A04AE|nr:WYL domain-containing protein [Arsenicicoccus sp. oral taxon 190]AKT51908.1 transcriptional regulator [Arsenicicoccus sp. oral taxon 190]